MLNTKSVELLKTKYNLGDITNFKVVELDQSKKRYVLDLSTVLSDDEDKENSMKFTKKLNVCEKSFYPQSYLKMVNDHNSLEEDKLRIFTMAEGRVRGALFHGTRFVNQLRAQHKLGILETYIF